MIRDLVRHRFADSTSERSVATRLRRRRVRHRADAVRAVEEIRPSTRDELERLSPDATIVQARFSGPVEPFVACRRTGGDR